MSVSIIIPAFNEQDTIGSVVEAVTNCPIVDEVVVIADGCCDNTAHIARAAGATVFELSVNQGKAKAMYHGLLASEGNYVCFLDADLIGLTSAHIEALVKPVVRGSVAMSVGIFVHGRTLTDLAQTLAPYLSGQRAMSRNTAFQLLSNYQDCRYGIEVQMTLQARKVGLSTKSIFLRDLTHVMKEEKLGVLKGIKARMRMYLDIAKMLKQS